MFFVLSKTLGLLSVPSNILILLGLVGAVLLLTLVVAVAPRVTPLTAAASALAASWAVEFLQLSSVPADLSRRSALARLVLGSTFNAPDLLWYAVGAAAGWAVHTALRAGRSGRGAGLR